MVKAKPSREAPSASNNELGEFLHAARKKKEFTLAEVASLLGLKSPQPIWNWENNKGSGIPAEMLLRLVGIYEISPAAAYELLMRFHQSRTRDKIHEKFEQARMKVLKEHS